MSDAGGFHPRKKETKGKMGKAAAIGRRRAGGETEKGGVALMCAGVEAQVACRQWIRSRPHVLAACVLCARMRPACGAEVVGDGKEGGRCGNEAGGAAAEDACDKCAAQRELFAWQFPLPPSRRRARRASGRAGATGGEDGSTHVRAGADDGRESGHAAGKGGECETRRVMVHQFDGAGWSLARQLLFVAKSLWYAHGVGRRLVVREVSTARLVEEWGMVRARGKWWRGSEHGGGG